jgi:GNAT superfamily N-acetyltransferase
MTITEIGPREQPVQLDDGTPLDLRVETDDERITVSAWDEHGNMVGIAWCDALPSAHPHEAEVEVTPSQRQRGIGALLLQALITAASEHGIATLTWTYPADDVAVRHLTEASGAVCARRVAGGRAKSTIFVPAA